jgi:vibriolysin
MNKPISLLALLLPFNIYAETSLNLHQAPLSQLSEFTLVGSKNIYTNKVKDNELKLVSQTKLGGFKVSRYQQLYKQIPIIGAQVTIAPLVNGHLFKNIQLNTNPSVSSMKALQSAKDFLKKRTHFTSSQNEKTELQIRKNKNNQLELMYLISFKTEVNNKPKWPFFLVDAQTGEIIKHWDNIQHYTDSGPGGNELVHEYWYGKDGLPGLEVSKKGETCTLDDNQVSLINLNFEWDLSGNMRTPYQYICGQNTEDLVNGAYSVGNDAYYFGHTIVDMYRDWYGIPALQNQEGKPQKLIMRVHFGRSYDNAFWDGETMTFGDGSFLYPLVSLDIAGHEVSHGFTEKHSNLEYHDEPGALNESFSDMAGIAARAYLLEKNTKMYNKSHLTPNEITWTIGETIIQPPLAMKALRFFDLPSMDNDSADCVNKTIARANNSICAISIPELVAYAESQYPGEEEEDEKQSYIVHKASGLFNRIFYFMAQEMGIKTAFQIMVNANIKYWTPTTNFDQASCDVVNAAIDLSLNRAPIDSAFAKVGMSITHCDK